MCLLILPRVCHSCNLVVMKRNIVLSINAKTRRHSAPAAYHWIQEKKTNTIVKSLSLKDNHSGSYKFLLNFLSFFLLDISPDGWRIYTLPDDQTSVVFVRLFACTECGHWIVRYIKCYLYLYILQSIHVTLYVALKPDSLPDLTHYTQMASPVRWASKLNEMFLGYLNPIKNTCFITIANNFRGDPIDASAKTQTLGITSFQAYFRSDVQSYFQSYFGGWS